MAQLVIRNLEEGVKKRLKNRAAHNRRSMEEEVREILRNAVKNDDRGELGFGTRFASHFRGIGLDKEIPEFRGVLARPVDFEK